MMNKKKRYIYFVALRLYSHWIVHTCTHTYIYISHVDRYTHLAQSVSVGGAERDELDENKQYKSALTLPDFVHTG